MTADERINFDNNLDTYKKIYDVISQQENYLLFRLIRIFY